MIEFEEQFWKQLNRFAFVFGILAGVTIFVLVIWQDIWISRGKMTLSFSSRVLGATDHQVTFPIEEIYAYDHSPDKGDVVISKSHISNYSNPQLFTTQSERYQLLAKKYLKELKVQQIQQLYARYGYPPLYHYARVLVEASDRYGLDYRLMPAISIIESSGGRYLFRPYNPFGWGNIGFNSFEDAIYYVAYRLRVYYYDLGWREPRVIAYKYNGPTPEEWGKKAEYLVSLMKKEEVLQQIAKQRAKQELGIR